MKLLKIGRDISCDIVLHSEKVSAVHAEITLMDNGDILLEDKGSRNGTFIMNQAIKAGQQVNIRRGDAIRFADVELQWSQVAMPDDNSSYKGVYSIGSHFNNDIQVTGATVSRYHATVKQAKDGKMYLFDHSKNGTTVNGTKISPNSPYRIKKGNTVVCGGVPVDLKKLPWPNNTWKKVVGIAAAIILLFGVGFGTYKLIEGGKSYDDSELYAKYSTAITMIVGVYHYEISAASIDLKSIHLPTIFVAVEKGVKQISQESLEKINPEHFTLLQDNKYFFLGTNDIKDFSDLIYDQYAYTATGFFVSEDGKLITNLHVVKPWLYEDVLARLKDCYNNNVLTGYNFQIETKGVLDNIYIAPQGKKFSVENTTKCDVLSAGDNKDCDVALIQSEKGELPSKATFIDLPAMLETSPDAIKVGTHMYTVGFPYGLNIQETDKDLLMALGHGGSITKSDSEYRFSFDASSCSGASGSPVFNKQGKVIGVLDSGVISSNTFNNAIKAQYIKALLEDPYKN